MARALITGITGQDGSYLAEFLLAQGYAVDGIVRRTSTLERSRLRHLYDDPALRQRLRLHYADLDDTASLQRLLVQTAPDEVYHLAGQSHVGLSFEIVESTCDLTAMGTIRLLEMIRALPPAARPRFYHASSSEIFGRPAAAPQNEETPQRPVSPYGCAKAFATRMVGVYRESFGLYAVNGITYNHESPRRGENFVTRKVCRGAAAIKLGLQPQLVLGNLDVRRDWGYAPDYVRGMWLSLQPDQPDDYVFATGIARSIAELAEAAFSSVGLRWQDHVVSDPALFRPAEPGLLVGDAAKARRLLGWEPTLDFAALIARMTEAELKEFQAASGNAT